MPPRNSVESQASQKDKPPGSFPSPPSSPGLNPQRNLAREVFERRDEYVKTRTLRLKIGTWNVAACPGTEKDIQGWFAQGKGLCGPPDPPSKPADEGGGDGEGKVESVVDQEQRYTPKSSTVPHDTCERPSDDSVDIYALGLQEIVDINSATEALRPFNDPNPARRWKEAVSEALPSGYTLVAEQQLIGLLLLVYASPGIAPTISSVSTTSVGTGLMGYMGNKGGVSARIVLGEKTKMVFVNSHLAAGNDKASLERRNWHASQIVQRTKFEPIDHGHGLVDEVGDMIGDEDFAFWFGDLNYRLNDIPGEDVRRLLLVHTRNEYDDKAASRVPIDKELGTEDEDDAASDSTTAIGSNPDAEVSQDTLDELDPSEDPASVQTTISSLIVHDQLREQMRLRKAFYEGWQEGPIEFLPTYKYDVGSVGMFDSSEKKRAPSWCDRILFRTRNDYKDYLKAKKEQEDVERRDKEMKARGLESGADEVIFDYDPDTDGAEEGYEERREVDGATEDFSESLGEAVNQLTLEDYTSYQRVLSSDHKPLVSIFAVQYEAVDPDLKAQVQQEVARELDRAENEGRPSVTVVFESQEESSDGCQFGSIRFCEEKSVLMTIANTSPVPATFEFVDRNESGPTPSWLRLLPHDAPDPHFRGSMKPMTLQPGDSINIEAIALVRDPHDLCAFNEGTSRPEDVLIMRVHEGRDHFIPAQAQWLQSVFGLSLDKLVRLEKESVRKQKLGAELDKNEVRGSAPRELFRLTEAIEENLSSVKLGEGKESASRVSRPAWPFLEEPVEYALQHPDLISIREALDTGAPIILPEELPPVERTEALAETLVLFLSCIPGRIVSLSLWNSLSHSLTETEKLQRRQLRGEELRSHVLDVLSSSPARSVSFTFITFMLARMAAELASLDEPSVVPPTPTASVPDTLLRRTTGLSLSSSPPASRRREIEAAFVDTFIPLVFEPDSIHKAGSKARKADMDKKRVVLDVFMRSKDEDAE